jgi:hypothetical protein
MTTFWIFQQIGIRKKPCAEFSVHFTKLRCTDSNNFFNYENTGNLSSSVTISGTKWAIMRVKVVISNRKKFRKNKQLMINYAAAFYFNPDTH